MSRYTVHIPGVAVRTRLITAPSPILAAEKYCEQNDALSPDTPANVAVTTAEGNTYQYTVYPVQYTATDWQAEPAE